ncbi:MAG: carbohydrate kinase family protein [Patescibacteria group bacterium UBA2163]
MNNIDFLAIGDTVTDAFITLEDIRIDTDPDPEDQGQDEICFRFGDKLPYEELTITPGVGNAANAAVSAHRLGLNTALVTDIGGDTFGKEILEYFAGEGLNTEYVRVHDNIPTNYHFVLSHNAERTILIKHQAYPYALSHIEPPKTLYFSSIGEGTEEYHDAIADYVEAHPDILFAFQPGTFQMKLGKERLKRIYARANMVFANKEEYQRILESKSDDVEALLQEMKELGPDTPILTDGRNGAYALTEEGIEHVSMFPDPAPPKERTGAGDAFSSTTAALVTEGFSLKDAMKRGTINSAYVVQKTGAQEGLLTREAIEEKLK